jgi:hypothetical protein
MTDDDGKAENPAVWQELLDDYIDGIDLSSQMKQEIGWEVSLYRTAKGIGAKVYAADLDWDDSTQTRLEGGMGSPRKFLKLLKYQLAKDPESGLRFLYKRRK